MRRTTAVLFMILALLVSELAFAQAEPDTDGDGLGDSRDRCPTEAGPIPLSGCPDIDNDGVPNIDDACAQIPGIPENSGCPLDTDGDGVGDFEDSCPNEAGTQENRGCIAPPDGTGTATPQADTNPLVPPAVGPCMAVPFLNGRVNGRNAPGADAEVIAVLEPNILYPVLGLIALPDEEESYLVIELEDVLITSIAAVPGAPQPAFDPAFLGGVFVATSAMNVGGACGPTPTGMLLPAIQKVRDAANRSSSAAKARFHRFFGDADGAATYYEIKLSDVLISSLQAAPDDGSTEGKPSFQDFHFLAANVVEGEDGDTLVFDLLDADPGDAEANFDVLLPLDGTNGESGPDAPTPPPAAGVLWLLKHVSELDGSSELSGDPASCEEVFFAALAAQGATVEAVGTAYGIEFLAVLPPGVLPSPLSQCDPAASDLPIDQFTINFATIQWTANEQGSAQTSLTKVGQGTLVLANTGIGDDGSVCIDLQRTFGVPPLCVPSPLPAEQ